MKRTSLKTLLRLQEDARENLRIWQAMKHGDIPCEWRSDNDLNVLMQHENEILKRIQLRIDGE